VLSSIFFLPVGVISFLKLFNLNTFEKLMKTLTIIIPVYNEENRVHSAFKAIKSFKNTRGISVRKFVFVNDGSKDSTLDMLKDFKKLYSKNIPTGASIQIVTYKKNRGRGYAIKQGLKKVSTDYALYVDSDLSIPFYNLKNFTAYLDQGYDLLIGSKKKPGAIAVPQRSILRQIVGYGHTVFGTLILGTFAWDFQGGFKIFSNRFINEVVIPRANQERWGLDMETVFLAKKLKYNFIEIPVVWGSVDEGSTVKVGRDIKRALNDMIEIRTNWFKNTWVLRNLSLGKIA